MNDHGFLVQTGTRLGVGGDRLESCDLDNAAIIPNDIPRENKVVGDGSPEKSGDERPAAALSSLSTAQKRAFFFSSCGT